MEKKLKTQCINFFHKMATRIVKKIQSIFGFTTLGPRAIVLNAENQVLLVKHTYQSDWYLPGGGVKNGESVVAALKRELQEEVGIITAEPELFGIYFHKYLGVNDYPIIFIVKNFTRIEVDSPEIETTAWFHGNALPEGISPGTKRRLDEYFKKTLPSEQW